MPLVELTQWNLKLQSYRGYFEPTFLGKLPDDQLITCILCCSIHLMLPTDTADYSSCALKYLTISSCYFILKASKRVQEDTNFAPVWKEKATIDSVSSAASYSPKVMVK